MRTYPTLLLYLKKGFSKVMNRLDKYSRENVITNVKGKVLDNSRGFNSQRRIKDGDNQSKGNGIQCRECEGFRQIQEEYTNFL